MPMIAIYRALARLALNEYGDVVSFSSFVGGTPTSPNKLRLTLTDGSFLDIWLSVDSDYAYHWERRRQTGHVYRWDNAPHYPTLITYPAHFHHGDESTVRESQLNPQPEFALRAVLDFVREHMI